MADEHSDRLISDTLKDMAEKAYPNASRMVSAAMSNKTADSDNNDNSPGGDEDPDGVKIFKTTRRKKGSSDSLKNEEILNGLDMIQNEIINSNKYLEGIASDTKVGNIVRSSMLEELITSRKLLEELATGGTGSGGTVSSGGSGSGKGGKGGGSDEGSGLKSLLEGGILARIFGMGGLTALGVGSLLGGAGLVAAGLGAGITGSMNFGEGSGNKGIDDILKKSNPNWSDDDMRKWSDDQAKALQKNDVSNQISTIDSDIARLKASDKINPSTQTESNITALETQRIALEKQKDQIDERNTQYNPSSSGPSGGGSSYIGGGNSTRGGSSLNSIPRYSADETRQQMRGASQGETTIGKNFGDVTRSRGGGHSQTQAEADGMKFFMSKGYTTEQAAVIMGNLQQESTFNPNIFNPNDSGGGSLGIAQWNNGKNNRDPRKDRMIQFVSEQFNKPYEQLTNQEKYQGQLGFVDHELHTSGYAGALHSLQTGNYGKFTHQYEGYGDNSEGKRLINARRILRAQQDGGYANVKSVPSDGGEGGGQVIAAPKSKGDVLDHLDKMKKLGMINGEECVALATASVGIRLGDGHSGGNVSEWIKAGKITSSTAAGTPIATFLGGMGNNMHPSDRYADGSVRGGVRGINRDHAAVLTGQYKTDKDGNVIAAEVADQSRHRGYQGVTHWIDNTHQGEQNIGNYSIIGTKAGLLGGQNNPEYQRLHGGAQAPNPTPASSKKTSTSTGTYSPSNLDDHPLITSGVSTNEYAPSDLDSGHTDDTDHHQGARRGNLAHDVPYPPVRPHDAHHAINHRQHHQASQHHIPNHLRNVPYPPVRPHDAHNVPYPPPRPLTLPHLDNPWGGGDEHGYDPTMGFHTAPHNSRGGIYEPGQRGYEQYRFGGMAEVRKHSDQLTTEYLEKVPLDGFPDNKKSDFNEGEFWKSFDKRINDSVDRMNAKDKDGYVDHPLKHIQGGQLAKILKPLPKHPDSVDFHDHIPMNLKRRGTEYDPKPLTDIGIHDQGIIAHMNNMKYQHLYNQVQNQTNTARTKKDSATVHQHQTINQFQDKKDQNKLDAKKEIGQTKPSSAYLSQLFAPVVNKDQMA